MNPALEEASGTSGAAPLTTFARVTLPVLLPGLLAPLILITLITAEQFELPLMIGLPARIIVFSYRIYFELNPAGGLPNYGGAAAISLPFILFGVLLLLAYNRAIRRAESFVTVTGKAYRQRRLALGPWRVPALLFPRSTSRWRRSFRRRCCCGPASSATPCRRARPRPTSASSLTASCSPIRRSGPA